MARKVNFTSTYNNDTTLALVNSYKYLGMVLSSELSWNLHINYVTGNAARIIYLKRDRSLVPSYLELFIYKTLVLSKL